jgi:hypothetical protein
MRTAVFKLPTSRNPSLLVFMLGSCPPSPDSARRLPCALGPSVLPSTSFHFAMMANWRVDPIGTPSTHSSQTLSTILLLAAIRCRSSRPPALLCHITGAQSASENIQDS